jgi:hypothetical protein
MDLEKECGVSVLRNGTGRALKSVSFIEKDIKRFPDTHGWAYAQFGYDAASDTFTPHGNDAKCGYECHSTVAAKDYIFTAYPKR